MAIFGTLLKKATPFGGAIAAVKPGLGYSLSKVLADVGQQFNMKDRGVSEFFGGYQPIPKAYAADNSSGQVAGVTTDNTLPAYNTDQNKPTTSFGGLKPTTGGQGAGAGGSGSLNLTAPIPDTAGLGDDTGRLREAYGIARSGIESQSRGLDDSYNLSKGDIENAIAESERAAGTQKESLANQYGGILRNQLKTYKDTNAQRSNIFSSLGTLESSAYGDQQQRADSSYNTDITTTDREKVNAIKGVDDELSAYKKQATSELSRFALQYQQGKQALAQALAQNNMEEAGAIKDSIDAMKSRANEIQNTLVNFSNQVALLKANGTDVRAKIGGINADEYAGAVNKSLTNQTNQLASLAPQQDKFSFTGYVGPDGKQYKSREEYQRLQGMA